MTRITTSCLLVAVVISACGGSDDSTEPAAESTDPADEATADVDTSADDDAADPADSDAADGDVDPDDAAAEGGADGGSVSVVWDGETLPLTRHACMSQSQYTFISAISDDGGSEFTVRTDDGFMEFAELLIGEERYYVGANIPSDRDAGPNPSALDVIEFEGGSHASGTLVLEADSDLAFDTLPDGAVIDFDIRC